MQGLDFMWRALFFSITLFVALFPGVGTAQTVHQDVQERVRGEVLEIVSESERAIMGTGASTTVQEVRVLLEEGERAGEVVRMEVEIAELKKGDNIYVFRMVTIDGSEYITFADFERRPVLALVAALFIVVLLVLARWQGVRALLSLALSGAAIIFLLVPALLAGYNPALVTIGISAIILAVVLFGTHGFTARATIAFLGTVTAVAFTSALAAVSVSAMRLSGFGADASVYLNFATNGNLDLAGLLLGGIIIGILGVLDDVSITQASVVQELKAANHELGFRALYERAINVGRDHVGSLVNTLALAYTAVSLPLILLYAKTGSPLMVTLNQEVVAGELLRIMIGSIGLILAVPLTTVIAAWYFKDKHVDDAGKLSHCGHAHH